MKKVDCQKTILFTMLVIGTMITISAHSWISMWMGLEINMLAFIPLLTKTNNMLSAEASLKYFLIQTLASSIFIISSLMMCTYHNLLPDSNLINNLIIFSLLIKLGAAPFHFWFPSMIEGLSWLNCLILFTWQKIAPFIILYLFINNSIIYLFILMSSIWGAVGGLNQTSVRKIMTYSSINHISWLMMALKMNLNLFFLYFIVYTTITLFLNWTFYHFNINHLNQLINFSNHNVLIKMLMMMNFMSLGGLPPFLGFLPKWTILLKMISYQMMLIMIIMVMCSLLTLLYYMKIMVSSLLILTSQYKTSFLHLNLSMNLNQFTLIMMSTIPLYSLMFLSFFMIM
uniref:NADH-ubiquinone oxidoreductase chain 2 n=1 Tax=Svistella anhuiensis TaxID=2152901 RepID=A0A856TAN7_9ORTH|nr:NADH dehydrogenase subunit 2 [Svistella anhuiensis]QFG38957.1 NADH dehydrogenase subunit 2 [Svistella anhuiensis]